MTRSCTGSDPGSPSTDTSCRLTLHDSIDAPPSRTEVGLYSGSRVAAADLESIIAPHVCTLSSSKNDSLAIPIRDHHGGATNSVNGAASVPPPPRRSHQLRSQPSAPPTGIEPIAEEEVPPRSFCCCARLTRRTVRRRFPSDDAMVDSMRVRRVAPKVAEVAHAPRATTAALDRVDDPPTPVLAPVSVTVAAPPPPIPHGDESVLPWLGFSNGCLRVWRRLVGVYEAVQLPLISLAHLVDTALDIAVVYSWSHASGVLHAARTHWCVVGAVCIALPTIISCISDGVRAPPPAAPHALAPSNRCALVLLDLLQLRGFYEAMLIRRLHYANSALSADGSQSRIRFSRTQESQEVHAIHMTRATCECAPMLLLQTAVFAAEYGVGGVGGPPQPWERVYVASILSSLFCLVATVYRLLATSPSWREKGGAPALVLFALILALHPLQQLLAVVLLIQVQPVWVVATYSSCLLLLTALLLIAADLLSPSRRESVTSARTRSLFRSLFVLAPAEFVSGAVSMADFVQSTQCEQKDRACIVETMRWTREYSPLLLCQAAAATAISIVYAVQGALWVAPIVGLMAGCIIGRGLAIVLLIPRVGIWK